MQRHVLLHLRRLRRYKCYYPEAAFFFALPMHAADPTTRAAYPFLKLADRSFNVLLPCLIFLNRDSPADPLIARKRGKALPCMKCLSVMSKSFS